MSGVIRILKARADLWAAGILVGAMAILAVAGDDSGELYEGLGPNLAVLSSVLLGLVARRWTWVWLIFVPAALVILSGPEGMRDSEYGPWEGVVWLSVGLGVPSFFVGRGLRWVGTFFRSRRRG